MSRQIHFQIESFLFLSPGNNTRKQMIVKVFLNFFYRVKIFIHMVKNEKFLFYGAFWELLGHVSCQSTFLKNAHKFQSF